MLGLGFEDDKVANAVECLVLDGGQPAVLGVTGLELRDFVHDVLPRPFCSGRVAGLPIDARQMQAEGGRVLGFILGGDEAIGFVLVTRFEGFLFPGNEVFAVVGAPDTASSTEQSGVGKASPSEHVTGPAITVQTSLHS